MAAFNLIDREDITHRIEAPSELNDTLMVLLRDEGFDVEGTCAGSASCGTCHIYVEQGNLGSSNEDEAAVLSGLIHEANNSRLACQINITDALNGTTLRLAPSEY